MLGQSDAFGYVFDRQGQKAGQLGAMFVVRGDGSTDIPCFSLVKGGGGTVIGVYDADNREEWGKAWGFVEDGRVSNLVSADYKQGSELTRFLTLAVENIAERIALAQHTYQG